MADDNSVTIQLELDERQANRSLKSFKSNAKKEGGKAGEGAGKAFSVGFNKFSALLSGLAVAGTIKVLADFEKQLIAVGKTTNFTNEQLDAFGKTILAMSKKIPVATDELLKISEIAGQLGINDSKQLAKFVDTIARLGVSVSGVSTEELALQLARITELTKGSLDDVDKLGSSLVALGNNFKVNEGQIASVALELSKIAGIYGVSSQAVLGLSTALAQSGVQAEVARTTFLTLFDRFGIAATKGGKDLKRFTNQIGITDKEFKNLVKNDPTKLILRLAESFKGLDGVEINAKLRELGISEKRVRTGFSALINTTDSLRAALELSAVEFEKNTALQEESERAFKALSNQFTRFINIIKAIGIELSGDLTKNLGILLGQLNDMLAIDGLTDKIKDFVIQIAKVGAIFVSISSAGAIFGFISSIRTMLFVASGGAGVFTKLGIAMIAFNTKAKIAAVGVRVLTKSLRVAKLVATFGLSLALEGVIEKFVELSNLSPMQKINNQIREQASLVTRLNQTLEQGTKEIQTRFGSRMVGLTESQKDKLRNDITFAQGKIAALSQELNRLIELEKPEKAEDVTPTPIPDPLAPVKKSLEEINFVDVGQTFEALGKSISNSFFIASFGMDEVKFKALDTAEQAAVAMQSMSKNAVIMGKNMMQGIGNAAGGAFASFGKAVASGEDAMGAFIDSLLASMGQMAVQLGTQFILQGVAYMWAGLPNGPSLIAAGAGLAAFGGLLSGLGGGGATDSAGAAGTAGTDTDLQTVEQPQIAEPKPEVQLIVQGDILDKRETGLALVDILNEVIGTSDARVFA